jgi:hypothetical protein
LVVRYLTLAVPSADSLLRTLEWTQKQNVVSVAPRWPLFSGPVLPMYRLAVLVRTKAFFPVLHMLVA